MLQMQHVIYATNWAWEMKYEDSLFYLINSCSKYFTMLFEQYFKSLNMGITATEHLALMVIMDNKECSQRDLARIILKDRANTGKLANTLAEKGLIKINLKTKNNRPVKILSVTKKGLELCGKIMKTIEPVIDKLHKEISDKVIEDTKNTIKNFRKVVENIVKINI